MLVIMAAGIGSRYGGLKQIDPIDEEGHLIIDFSIYDGIKAGFEKIVFIIKREDEESFKEVIGRRIEEHIEVIYVYQDLDFLPEGYDVPEGRVKPWGTAHALLSCESVIHGPFAIINADDYYGPHAFQSIYDFLMNLEQGEPYHYGMVGYLLENTLTEHGYVARGVCQIDENHRLVNIHERTHIEKRGKSSVYTEDGGQTWVTIPEGSTVSMNMWGFSEEFVTEVKDRFIKFLEQNLQKDPLKCEYFLPSIVGELLEEGKATVKVLKTSERWYGVTYKEDKERVVNAIAALKDQGIYPSNLWESFALNHKEKDPFLPIKEIWNQFQFEGEYLSSRDYGSGHINDTFLVEGITDDQQKKQYIIQRINHNIFKNPEQLMSNISRVTDHLRKKIILNGGDPNRETLNIIKTKNEKDFYLDQKGEYWRAYVFITDAMSLDQVEETEDFYESGVAFGNFQYLLSDFPAETLYETIPNFHHTKDRIRKFHHAIEKDVCHRVGLVEEEIAFILDRERDAVILDEMLERGELPLRVTHNDTKLNNVMLDKKTGKGICVVDLDTVMPGLAIHDFGDSIRFGSSTGLEDEKDLSKVSCDMDLFAAYVKGFLEGCKGSLKDIEIDNLVLASKVMTLECGIRFLTDYLEGDHYFKIQREEHNLDRTRTQLKLVADMEKKWDTMIEIVNQYR